MKKLISTLAIYTKALLLLAILSGPGVFAAGGPSSAIELTASAASAPADGSSKITISVKSFWYNCNGGGYSSTKEECDYLDPPGWDGTTTVKANEKTYISADAGAATSVSEITTDGSGNASFTVTSAKIGSYYVYSKTSSGFVKNKVKLTFTDPNPQPEPVKTTPATTQKTTQTSQNNTTQTKPVTPEVKLLDSTGTELKSEEGGKVIFKSGDPIVLSGKTVPNGIVKLYIFSNPQEAEVTADENGDWTYTVASIEPGDHRVEVEVTDPATGETSERQEVLGFTVAQADAQENNVVSSSDNSTFTQSDNVQSNTLRYVMIGITVAVLLTASVGYLFWKKKYSSLSHDTEESLNTSEQSTSYNTESTEETPNNTEESKTE